MNSKLRAEIFNILNGVKSKNPRGNKSKNPRGNKSKNPRGNKSKNPRGNKRKISRKRQTKNISIKKPIINKVTSKKMLFSSSVQTSVNGKTRRRSRLYFNDGNKIHVKSEDNGVIKSFVIPKKLQK